MGVNPADGPNHAGRRARPGRRFREARKRFGDPAEFDEVKP